METDDTGHGTRDTGQPLRAAAPPTAPQLRPASALTITATTGHGTRDTENTVSRDAVTRRPQHATGQRDTVPQDQERDNGTPSRKRPVAPRPASRALSRWRPAALIVATRTAVAASRTAAADRRDAERDARDAAARDAAAVRDALSRDATRKRKPSGPADTAELEDPDDIAPMPRRMKIMGVWVNRTLGNVLLSSSLLVSGFYTVKVGMDEPLKMGGFAIAFTLALEGNVWYLNRLRERFKLEGDGTFSINLVILGIITLIAALIGGHAIWESTGGKAINIPLPVTDATVPLDKLIPAIAVALMSAIGAFTWAKRATFMHRAKLRALKQIDPRAPKFSAGSWVFCFWETFWSLRHAFKYRITEAEAAVRDWRYWKSSGKPTLWPLPAGFRYVGGRLQEIPLEELTRAAERDTAIAALTGRDTDRGTRATGRGTARDTALRDTAALTGHPGTGRPALPSGSHGTHGTTGHGSRDSADGTHGTVADGSRDTGHGTAPTGHAAHVDGTPAADYGTAALDNNGTRDIPRVTGHHGTGHGTRDETDDLAGLLKYSEHLIAVTEAFPGWQHGDLPSVRAITKAIHAYRFARDGGSYNSSDTSGKVKNALVKLRSRPELLDLMKVQQDEPAG